MVAATEPEEKTYLRDPLRGPSSVCGVNLLNSQWAWMNDLAREHRVSRSELIRAGLTLLQEAIDQRGAKAVLFGES